MKILFVTSQWPTDAHPNHSPFVRVEVEHLRAAGIDVDVFHYAGGWRLSQYLTAAIQFHRRLRTKTYQLIQVRFGQCGLVTLTQRRLPVVVRFGGSDLLGWREADGQEPIKSKLLRLVSRTVAARAAEVILPAANMAASLPQRDYHVIPSGIDLELFRPMDQASARLQLGLPATGKLVLFAANPRNIIKRFELAQQSVTIANDTIPAQLVVAHGVPHEKMPLYMNACDALILTSQHEGSPNVVKEALACNLPVAAVNVGDVQERVGQAESCAVSDQAEPAILAEALLHTLRQKERPNLRHLVANLDAAVIARKTIQVYSKALSQHSL